MNYKIIVDILDNSEISKKISNGLYNKLRNNNYDTLLLDNNLTIKEKVNEINKYGTNTIVISNQLNNANTSEIIYSLYYDNILPLLINDKLGNILNISKFYQLRLPSDTSQDYYEIIRETKDAESIIIRYENIDESKINSIVDNLYDAINDYIYKENIYIVQSGDSLYSIANKFDISVAELKKANDLSSNTLSIGQELIIPKKMEEEIPNEEPSPFETYIVKQGDSLYKIANNFNTTITELKELNNLNSNTLSIGQVLKIPNRINENYETYTVASGDSLYKIATRFNTTVSTIQEINNLSTTTLSIGQKLLVPKIQNTTKYTVVSGDSLYKIANKFNTTVNEIKELNNLETNNLSIGQVLQIPSTNKTYIVKSGDSLYKIANQFNTTVNEIKELNNLTTNNLSIGQTLLIP